MSAPIIRAEPAGPNINDIYHILFRRKVSILACSFAGLALTAAAYYWQPPPFESEAKLFIRYISDAKSPAQPGTAVVAKSPDQRGETILDSEMEIITSWDLARQVAAAIGPAVILGQPAGPDDLNQAAAMIKTNLLVEAPPRSSVIRLVFKHPDRAVVAPVLREIIDRYLHLHVEIHRSAGMMGSFLTQETAQLRTSLVQTEAELRKSRNSIGVLSIDDAKKTYTEQIAALRQQIFTTQAELAERSAILRELKKRTPSNPKIESDPTTLETPVPSERVEEYSNLIYRLGILRHMEQDLLVQFRDENARVKEVRGQISETEAARRELAEQFPLLARVKINLAAPGAPEAPRPGADADDESVRIVALESKLKTLNTQLAELRTEATAIDNIDASITELLRKKDLEEANYRYYSASLEQARIDEALGAGQVSNISEIQTPSPPARDRATEVKFLGLLAGGGICLGFGWAFFAELYLDRTVKRPADVERLLHPPLFFSIPAVKGIGNTKKMLFGPNALSIALAPFHEALRDQTIGFFESQGLVRKPKLVAVTGIGSGSGVSTIAAGLAQSLSKTGEGTVLLVDMTLGQEAAHHFRRGEVTCDLDQVLEASEPARVQTNLFVVTDNSNRDQLARNLPQRFSRLAPKLKASTFDYIIFDLPAVSPISITPRVAAFMDLVLLAVESESTEQEVLQRAAALLSESKTPVGVVLNKTRSYVPSWLKQELSIA